MYVYMCVFECREWKRAGKSDKKRGRAITCLLCGGKLLILNSMAFHQHVDGKSHRKKLDDDTEKDANNLFMFADVFRQFTTEESSEDEETHQERLMRIRQQASEKAVVPKDDSEDDDGSNPGLNSKRNHEEDGDDVEAGEGKTKTKKKNKNKKSKRKGKGVPRGTNRAARRLKLAPGGGRSIG